MATAGTPDESDDVLVVDRMSKRYGTTTAVDEISLTVRRGEIFGILGTNGAGKTTTVECAQGIRRPDGGSIRVLGHDPITERAAIRGRVGSQLQNSALPSRMRTGEAVRLFAADSATAAATIDTWDLGPLERKAFGDLSGGQQQRLFLALALLNEPEVVFLDELTQGLDPAARRDVWDLVLEVRERGTTVVLVTHLMEEAQALCDRVSLFVGGRIVEGGTPDEIVDRHGGPISISFDGTPADLEWLRTTKGVTTARHSDGRNVLEGPSSMLPHLGAAMVDHGVLPDRISIAQPTLEDAVMRLIDSGTGGTP